MYIAVVFRSLFMVCVPLFIITTGYLMRKKELSKKYYFGIKRVLIEYLLFVILYLVYNKIYNDGPFTIRYIIKSILSFDVGYSWYVEMYVGLFLLIPFVNLIYNNLKDKKQKKMLVLTMMFLTSFQGIIDIKYKFIPNWWVSIYPLTYYFIGCYLSEYKINLKRFNNILLFIITLGIYGVINVYFSKGNYFNFGVYNQWESIFNLLLSVLLFNFIVNLDLSKTLKCVKNGIYKISELSFLIYLLSAIIDNALYFHIFKNVNFLSFLGYFKIVPLTFLLSLIFALVVNFIYKMIDKYVVQWMEKRFIR